MRYRCPACGTRRTSFVAMVEHKRNHGHAVCDCGGYDYPHRPLSPYCHKHPHASLHHALRAGDMTAEEIQDVLDELAWGEGRPLKVWPGETQCRKS